ncbi:MAG: hypothetical protein ABIC18_02505 [Candidatus Omnitrophota bacterium]
MPINISTPQAIIPALIFLLVIWLVYRFEIRMKPIVNNAVYNNFPFLKDTVSGLQQKIDYINTRLEAFESRMVKLENKPK